MKFGNRIKVCRRKGLFNINDFLIIQGHDHPKQKLYTLLGARKWVCFEKWGRRLVIVTNSLISLKVLCYGLLNFPYLYYKHAQFSPILMNTTMIVL